MAIIIRVPDPETGELSRISITPDLEIDFLDYDMAYDDMMHVMTGDTSFFRSLANQIQEYPIRTLCASNLIPIVKLGIVSCDLVLDALEFHENANASVICADKTRKLIEQCKKQWGRRRYEFSRLNHIRQDLTSCWNKEINLRGKNKHPMPSFGDDTIITAALGCADFVSSFQSMLESRESYFSPPKEPCHIAELARHVIAYNNYGWRTSIPFREVLSQMPGGLEYHLRRIEIEQGKLMIRILETLP